MIAYYNEIDKYRRRVLEIMIERGEIAPGVVDGRSIKDVRIGDLQKLYAQGVRGFHFFVGGTAGWPDALRQAGWPDDREVWTGSCPCQPFSVAGKHRGLADERHLWPDWWRLIQEFRPPVIYGEQVEGRDGIEWLSVVLSDLESVGYEVAPFDLPAAGVGAPHRRQRLYFVARSDAQSKHELRIRESVESKQGAPGRHGGRNGSSRQPDGEYGGLWPEAGRAPESGWTGAGNGSDSVADAVEKGLEGIRRPGIDRGEPGRLYQGPKGSIRTELIGFGPWADVEFRPCIDRDKEGRIKYRPIKPGIQPVAHGDKGRTNILSASGDGIVPELAKTFVRAFMESEDGTSRAAPGLTRTVSQCPTP